MKVKQIIKHIPNVLKILGLMLVLFVVFLAILPKTPLSDNLKSLVVLSGSMEPSVKTGSLILTKSVDTETLQVGDIITFQQNDADIMFITHRIDSINEDGSFTTKGDANDTIDNTSVLPEEVKGKMLFTIPYIGYLINFSKTQQGLLILVVFPSLLVIMNETRTIREELKNEIKKYKDKKKDKMKVVSQTLTAVTLLFILIFFTSENTLAYFSDTEVNSGNVISVGVWDDETRTDSNEITLDSLQAERLIVLEPEQEEPTLSNNALSTPQRTIDTTNEIEEPIQTQENDVTSNDTESDETSSEEPQPVNETSQDEDVEEDFIVTDTGDIENPVGEDTKEPQPTDSSTEENNTETNEVEYSITTSTQDSEINSSNLNPTTELASIERKPEDFVPENID